MFRGLISEAFRSRIKSIEKNYRLALGKHDRDGVHDLRVGLKRMRALFDLVEALDHGFHAKQHFKPFRRIARNTGLLRDAQVQQEMLAPLAASLERDFGEYAPYLRDREEEGWRMFHRFAGAGHPLKKLKKARAAIDSTVGSLGNTTAVTRAQGRFYNLKNELIILTRSGALVDSSLHDVRKLAKTVHYTLEIVGPAFPGFSGAKTFTGAIKTLHHELGKWHDYTVSLEYLRNFLSACGIDAGAEPYAALAGELRRAGDTSRDTLPAAFAAFNEVAEKI